MSTPPKIQVIHFINVLNAVSLEQFQLVNGRAIAPLFKKGCAMQQSNVWLATALKMIGAQQRGEDLGRIEDVALDPENRQRSVTPSFHLALLGMGISCFQFMVQFEGFTLERLHSY
jgi:hypothetical protein